MKGALEVVMAWQLRNPECKDHTEVIDAVKFHVVSNPAQGPQTKSKTSELPARLATHFLELTIRPLFASQKHEHPDITPAGHRSTRPAVNKPTNFNQKPAWKSPNEAYAIDLLRWVLLTLDPKGVESNWGSLVPPILKIIDDLEIAWKATGCELLTLLLKSTPPALLARTGLGKVFEETIMPLFTYLPSLTPEADSVVLLDKTHSAVIALTDALYPPSQPTKPAPNQPTFSKRPTAASTMTRSRYLDQILHKGIFAPFAHSGANVRIAEVLLAHLIPILNALQLDTVRHLQRLLPIISGVLAEPLGSAYPPLLEQALLALQSAMLNAWPRISAHRGEIFKGLCVCWVRIGEEEELKGEVEALRGARKELEACAEMLLAILKTDEAVNFKTEVSNLAEADQRVASLFKDLIT